MFYCDERAVCNLCPHFQVASVPVPLFGGQIGPGSPLIFFYRSEIESLQSPWKIVGRSMSLRSIACLCGKRPAIYALYNAVCCSTLLRGPTPHMAFMKRDVYLYCGTPQIRVPAETPLSALYKYIYIFATSSALRTV